MEEQQVHLRNLLQQKDTLQQEISFMETQLSSKKELFVKVMGVIEYLTQIGVTLPEVEEDS